MSETSPQLNLPYIQPSQAQKHVTHNQALQRLDALVQLRVLGMAAQTPPASPGDGDLHALGQAPQSEWAGQAGNLALWDGASWQFIAPREGWRAFDLATRLAYVFDGGDWRGELSDLNNLDGVGIATMSDAVNRLAVASDASLFSHAGTDHRIKVNKATDTDTASLLFQSGWTGHAEIGLAGDTDFSVKTSADGITWTEALRVAAATGAVTGAAVQATATDTTPGRLMRADFGYGPGNLLGTASQSGGTPTGAVIERGGNANGDYVRFADGTQICWNRVTLTYISAGQMGLSWTYPASFLAGSGSGISVSALFYLTSSAVTPAIYDIGATAAKSITTTSALLRLMRVTGTTDFLAGDTADLRATAIGRWF